MAEAKHDFKLSSSDCLSNPCQNQGSCEETKDNFKCLCPSAFTGVTCEKGKRETYFCKSNFCFAHSFNKLSAMGYFLEE